MIYCLSPSPPPSVQRAKFNGIRYFLVSFFRRVSFCCFLQDIHTPEIRRSLCAVSLGQLCPKGGAGQGRAGTCQAWPFQIFTTFYTNSRKDSRNKAPEHSSFQSLQTYSNIPAYLRLFQTVISTPELHLICCVREP